MEVNSTHEWASVIGCAAECGFTRSSSSGWWWWPPLLSSQDGFDEIVVLLCGQNAFCRDDTESGELWTFLSSHRYIHTTSKPKLCAICGWAVSSAVCGVDHSSLAIRKKRLRSPTHGRMLCKSVIVEQCLMCPSPTRYVLGWLVDGHVINSLNNNNNNKVATVDDNDYETISSSLFAISVLRLFAI